MSETVFKFLLSELTKARITCKSCNVTTEILIGDLPHRTQSGQCPVCRQPIQAGNVNGFEELADAIRHITGSAKLVEVEFAIPITPNPAKP